MVISLAQCCFLLRGSMTGLDYKIAIASAGKVQQFGRHRVLVLGDIMVDRYIVGQVRRISPEAPIPVLQFERSHTVLGGAGNVAHNIAALGGNAILVGVIGDDQPGAELSTGRYGVPANVAVRSVIDPSRPTTVKTRFISGSHQIMRLDEETAEPVGAEIAEKLLRTFADSIKEAAVVILSDYAKGVLCDDVLAGAIAIARQAGRPVIADPKRRSFEAYRHVSVLTPNEIETEQATGVGTSTDACVERAGLVALRQSEAAAVLITRSARGVTLIGAGREPLHLAAEAREVADVSGAGDTLVAALATMLACGADLADAAAVANLCAGIAVGKQGTATVTQAELSAALRRQEIRAADEKSVTLELALQTIAGWRSAGAQIGFTNGCFDLLHPGHVRLLKKARAGCDRLIVGLNTDASVKRLKGPHRPIQNETARATVLASLSAVDLVILFDEDTPLGLIEALRPNKLFKGADYRIDEVVGADLVHQYGGQVIMIDLEQGFSTTGIIERMNGSVTLTRIDRREAATFGPEVEPRGGPNTSGNDTADGSPA